MSRNGDDKPTLWMAHSQTVSAGLLQTAAEPEEECAAGENSNENYEGNDQNDKESKPIPKGMSPSDPKFLALVAGFILFVSFTSRMW